LRLKDNRTNRNKKIRGAAVPAMNQFLIVVFVNKANKVQHHHNYARNNQADIINSSISEVHDAFLSDQRLLI
jgi:hypothetical protein